MGLNCCGIFAKVLLIFSNIVYMLISVGLIGFGTFFLIHHADIELVTGNETIGWFVGFIFVGLATFVVSLLGIIGTLSNKHQLLIAYMIATLVLILLLLTGTVLSLYSTERNSTRVGNQFLRFIGEYNTNCSKSSHCEEHDYANDAVDLVQEDLECCGLYGPVDWYNRSFIPESCSCATKEHNDKEVCRELKKDELVLIDQKPEMDGIWNVGCNSTLEGIVNVHFFLMGSFTFLFAFCQLCTVFTSFGLCLCVVKEKKYQERIGRLQSVAYTPLDSYPANTVSNNSFVADGGDEELLRDDDDGKITIQ